MLLGFRFERSNLLPDGQDSAEKARPSRATVMANGGHRSRRPNPRVATGRRDCHGAIL
jgi:hypothetical protein